MALTESPTWLEVSVKYTAVLTVGCMFAYYWGCFDNIIARFRPPPPPAVAAEPAERPSKKKRNKNKTSERATGSDSGSTIDTKKLNAGSGPTKRAVTSTSGDNQTLKAARQEDGDAAAQEKKDFALSYSKAQKGINFSAGKQNNGRDRLRTVASKEADEAPRAASRSSSSTGKFADDENSMTASPAVQPTILDSLPDASGVMEISSGAGASASNGNTDVAAPDTTGVRDMLEPAKQGPKVLTLKIDHEASKSKQPRPAVKAPEVVETKKQRQARRKREEEKERIAQSNAAHDAKRQQQMRGARIAEGTSKQTKADMFKPALNAWKTPSQESNGSIVKQPSVDAVSVTPLDTFEPKAPVNTTNNGSVTAQTVSQVTNGDVDVGGVNGIKQEIGTQKLSALAASERERAVKSSNSLPRTQAWADEMEEDDQMKRAQEESRRDSAGWESVVHNKKDKKKTTKGNTDIHGNSSTRTNGRPHQSSTLSTSENSSSRQQSKQRQPQNGFSALPDLMSNNNHDGASGNADEGTWEA